jgi:hypothetical protein
VYCMHFYFHSCMLYITRFIFDFMFLKILREEYNLRSS